MAFTRSKLRGHQLINGGLTGWLQALPISWKILMAHDADVGNKYLPIHKFIKPFKPFRVFLEEGEFPDDDLCETWLKLDGPGAHGHGHGHGGHSRNKAGAVDVVRIHVEYADPEDHREWVWSHGGEELAGSGSWHDRGTIQAVQVGAMCVCWWWWWWGRNAGSCLACV